MELLLDTNLIVRQSFARESHVHIWRCTIMAAVSKLHRRGWCSLAVLVLCPLLLLLPTTDCKSQVEEKSVQANKEFTISLDSNRTTGYKWDASFDKAFLKLMTHYYKRPTNQRVGAGGTQIFIFLPVRQGETKIRFVYKRPWEKSIAREKTFAIHINR